MKTSSATAKYLRIAPSKLEKILAKIRGKSYRFALDTLRENQQPAGTIIWQTLYAATANARKKYGWKREFMVIHEAYANQGPILKRMRPRAKGRAFSIQKKLSHLTIVISFLPEDVLFDSLDVLNSESIPETDFSSGNDIIDIELA